jgi:hypothetical protein
MLPMNASAKYAGIAGGVLLLSMQLGCATPYGQSGVSGVTGLLVLGLVLGGVIMFFIMFYINKFTRRTRKVEVIKESSHTVVESMRRVFKIVFAEGHFNEIYTFEDTKKLFGFIPSTRRALVIIEAKVLVGYNFEKCEWEIDERNQKVKLISFPEPEILSIEPDYKYYNFDENIFNLLNREDLGRIQTNGKKQVEAAAMKSHLPRIAADQMRTLLLEVVQSKNWQLENIYKITESEAKVIQANK